MNPEQTKRKYSYVPVAVLCNILWGSAIPFINVGYRLFDISSAGISSLILFAGMRFFLAGCITILIRSASLKKPALPQKGNWKAVLKLSMFQTVGQYVLFYIAVANTASVEASIIQGLGAFVSILIAGYVFRYEKMNGSKWLGGILGVLGVIVMNWKSGSFGGSFSLMGEGAMLLSMTCGALSAGLIKKYTQKEDPVTLNGWQFAAGGLVMIAAGLAGGGRLHPQNGKAFLVLLYLDAVLVRAGLEEYVVPFRPLESGDAVRHSLLPLVPAAEKLADLEDLGLHVPPASFRGHPRPAARPSADGYPACPVYRRAGACMRLYRHYQLQTG